MGSADRLDTPSAFAAAYRSQASGLLRFFYSRTLCSHVAADLTAETFAKAWQLRRRFDPAKGSSGAWLQALARQELLHYLRHEAVSRRARRRLGIVAFAATPDELYEIEQRLDHERQFDALHRSLGSLKPNAAEALRLRVVEQLPYDEIAEKLAISPGAARVRVARALHQLNEQLSGVTP